MLLSYARKGIKSMSRKQSVEVKQKCVELYDKGVSTEKLYKEHYLKYGRGSYQHLRDYLENGETKQG